MKSYRVILSKTIRKQLWKLDQTLTERIIEAIDVLADNPRPADCIKLEGKKNSYESESEIIA